MIESTMYMHRLSVPSDEQTFQRYVAITTYLHNNSRYNVVWVDGVRYSFKYVENMDVLMKKCGVMSDIHGWCFVCPVEWRGMVAETRELTESEFVDLFESFIKEFMIHE